MLYTGGSAPTHVFIQVWEQEAGGFVPAPISALIPSKILSFRAFAKQILISKVPPVELCWPQCGFTGDKCKDAIMLHMLDLQI